MVKFLTESPAGGLPLGFLVLSNRTEATLDAGLQDLQALMPDQAFGGRGTHVGYDSNCLKLVGHDTDIY